MCRNKSSFYMREHREGKKHPPFFEFFQSIKFFLICPFKKTYEEFYSLRARYRREYTSRNNNNSLIYIDCSLEREDIYTHTQI